MLPTMPQVSTFLKLYLKGRVATLSILPHPIPKPFTKNGEEYVFEVVPHIEVVNHLGIGFCQALRGVYHWKLKTYQILMHHPFAPQHTPKRLHHNLQIKKKGLPL